MAATGTKIVLHSVVDGAEEEITRLWANHTRLETQLRAELATPLITRAKEQQIELVFDSTVAENEITAMIRTLQQNYNVSGHTQTSLSLKERLSLKSARNSLHRTALSSVRSNISSVPSSTCVVAPLQSDAELREECARTEVLFLYEVVT